MQILCGMLNNNNLFEITHNLQITLLYKMQIRNAMTTQELIKGTIKALAQILN